MRPPICKQLGEFPHEAPISSSIGLGSGVLTKVEAPYYCPVTRLLRDSTAKRISNDAMNILAGNRSRSCLASLRLV
jgi:hypothetical protein